MQAEKTLIKQSFPVLNMSCAACAARVDKTLNQHTGVKKASVNYASAMAQVEYDPDLVSPAQLRQAVVEAGYDLVIGQDEQANLNEAEKAQAKHYRSLRSRTIYALCLAVPLMVVGMVWMDVRAVQYLMWILSTPIVFWLGRDFFIRAAQQLRHGTSNMDTLVALSTGIAYIYSMFTLFFPSFWTERGMEGHLYFESAAMIIAFILLGRTLEARAKGNTSAAIRKLMDLQPDTVTRRNASGEWETVAMDEVRQGDRLLVKPGERIPVDGSVEEGQSYVDESAMTGEPVAVLKSKDDAVYAGSINQRGSLTIVARQVGSDTRLAHIIRLVQEAQGSKAPVQQLVDRIAAVFVPTIIAIAVLTFAAWWVLSPANGLTQGILSAVTVLIIACPCALGLATPTAIMVGIGKGAEQGILIKDAESIETIRRTDVMLFDKTGTLTAGKPTVANERWENATAQHKQLLFSLESTSEHPLAEAIAQHLQTSALTMDAFQSYTGKGVSGVYDNQRYFAGNEKLLQEQGIDIPSHLTQQAAQWRAEAKTLVWFADAARVIALLAITDPIRPSTPLALQHLQQMGIRTEILTGDNAQTAAAIAQTCGIAHFEAGLLPEDKANYISHLQQQGHCVAMIGDGINDSAALAQADTGIAMGEGSDIALDVAKMTLVGADLLKLADAIRLSRATVNTIRQNLFWAFIYNIIGVPLAAGLLYPINGFLLNPMWAGAAMALSSVCVVTNSLRLRRFAFTQTAAPEKTSAPSAVVRTYQVKGMTCHHCQARVLKALQTLENVEVEVSLERHEATIRFNGRTYDVEELQKVITDIAGDYTISI